MKLGKIINCKYISEKIFNYIKKKKTFFSELNILEEPFYFSILINNNKDSLIFLQNKNKKTQELNIENKLLNFVDFNEKKIFFILNKISNNSQTDGVLIQMPLRSDLSYIKLSRSVSYKKDLDFILNNNIGEYNLCYLKKFPSIVRSCFLLINLFNIKIKNKSILIINKSNLIGKPLLNFFLNQKVSVTIASGFCQNIDYLLKKKDLIFSAVGLMNFLKFDNIKKNSIVFDLGFGENKNKIFGDLENSLKFKKMKLITTVPFGIGALNINFLLENIIKFYFFNKVNK